MRAYVVASAVVLTCFAAFMGGCGGGAGGDGGAGVVGGHVTDAATGAPVAGVRVYAVAAGEGSSSIPVGTPEVTTASDGSFRLDNAPEGKVDLLVRTPDQLAEPDDPASAYAGTTVRLTVSSATEAAATIRLLPRGVTVLSLGVSPQSVTVSSDTSMTFEYTLVTSDDGEYAPTWTVEGLIGNIDSGGVFEAGAAGQGTVRATLGGASATSAVTVTDCVIATEEDFIHPDDQSAGLTLNAEGAYEVIVGYVPAAVATRAETWSAVDEAGGYVTRDLDVADAALVTVAPEGLEALRDDWRIAYIEPNVAVSLRADADQVAPWNIRSVRAPEAWGASADAQHVLPGRWAGEGVRVALIDTGIDESHSDLVVAGGTNILNPKATPTDDNGHGTFAAGIIGARDNETGIVGVAPACELYAVKVLDLNGNGRIADVISGIEWCVENGVRVINLSLGITQHSLSVKAACDAAWDGGSGAILVAASGNNEPVVYPANYGSVISVGATTQDDGIASFSSQGPPVELCAPGDDVYSCSLGSGFEMGDGTSFSAPHVAGAAALLFSSGRYSDAAHVRQHLRNTALDLGSEGRDQTFGYGKVDVYAAWESLGCADVPIL